MKILLDANALLWLLADDKRLSLAARASIEDAAEVSVSEVSLWEIAVKISIGKLHPIPGLHETVRDLGFRRLNLRNDYLQAYERLPFIHRDPFDRMLVAQALSETASLLTSDSHLEDYGIKIVAAES